MSRFRIPLTAVAAVALLTGAAAAPALAEGTTTTPPPGSSTAPRPNVSAEQLKSFADASLEVDKISQEYAPKLQAAKTAEDQEAVRKEATEKMVDAVQKKGLTVEDYRRIAIAARANPDLAREIETYRQQAN
ncbi:MAG TPA: DUF4168 domain-containing protein [Alphaproteobacteria bacterium]|jgi:hypothetical protein